MPRGLALRAAAMGWRCEVHLDLSSPQRTPWASTLRSARADSGVARAFSSPDARAAMPSSTAATVIQRSSTIVSSMSRLIAR
jgi:hypothetical protein